MRQIELSDKQFDNLEVDTRRRLMEQLMMVHTPKYLYTLGANSHKDTWLMMRYDRQECIGPSTWEKGYQPEQIDEWR